MELWLSFYYKRRGKWVCLKIYVSWENTEKCKTFSVLIERGVIKIDKDGIDSARFMELHY